MRRQIITWVLATRTRKEAFGETKSSSRRKEKEETKIKFFPIPYPMATLLNTEPKPRTLADRF